jgi:plastocyanin
MNKLATPILLVALTAGLHTMQAGEITGKITLKGTPPAEKNITPLKEDPTCGKFHTSTPTTKFYVVGSGGELADVVVSLEGISGKSKGASATPAVLDQKTCIYVPQILAVQTGQKITVKNSDPVMHNVHSQPTVKGNKEDNKVQMPNGADLSFSYDQPEDFVKFKCDVHPWMFAWVSVFDHPYFAVTKADGTFKISDVPAGKYKLKISHRKAGTTTQDIEVKDDAPTTVALALDAK